MTKEDREIPRKLKVLRHAEKTDHVARTCRYFGVGRSSFYRWKAAYEQRGESGLINDKPIPKNPANQPSPEIVEKVLYLRSKYHLESIKIVLPLARYHGITISDAGITRILHRNGVGRLPLTFRTFNFLINSPLHAVRSTCTRKNRHGAMSA